MNFVELTFLLFYSNICIKASIFCLWCLKYSDERLSMLRYEDKPVMFEERKRMPCCFLSAADYSFCRASPSASSSDLADPAVPLEATPGDAAPCWLPSGVTTVSE